VAAEGGFELAEDVSFEGPLRAALCAFFDRDGGAAGDHLLVGLDADEGVPADALAAFDGLEQEGFGLLGGDAEEGGDRGLKVCRDGAVDGHQRVGLG